MHCSGCGERLMVFDKTNSLVKYTRRRRRCRGCGRKVTTYEIRLGEGESVLLTRGRNLSIERDYREPTTSAKACAE